MTKRWFEPPNLRKLPTVSDPTHRDRQMSYAHRDAYEGGPAFDPSRFMGVFWDDEIVPCDTDSCRGQKALVRAVRALYDMFHADEFPRTVADAWKIFDRNRDLDGMFDPHRSELIEFEGHSRLAVCIGGCSRHEWFIVDMPWGLSGFKNLDDARAAVAPTDSDLDNDLAVDDVTDGSFDEAAEASQDAQRRPSADVDLRAATGQIDGRAFSIVETNAQDTAPKSAEANNVGEIDKQVEAFEALEGILLAADANVHLLRDSSSADRFYIVDKKQIDLLSDLLRELAGE